MNFGKSQGGNLKNFSLWQPHQQTKAKSFFMFGMNISYLLFSNFDLPINYNEFHEIAANVTQ